MMSYHLSYYDDMQNLPIYSVAELNAKVRATLELEIASVAVNGEISNLVKASSGHYYFTLKDAKAQIRCAFFSGLQKKSIHQNFSNGQQVTAYGKVSLYEPRGDYQLIVSHIQDTGVGLLYQQFIELKNRLQQQGLFAPELKKPIPKYPKQIGVITSPIGAALHDIQTTLARRFPIAKVKLYPTEVQGAEAHKQIISALEKANTEANDVILLARGGGSIEDLWAFNHEALAIAIVASQIPIITGIGHETDFTIADFVADLRAATPTAAAEKATPDQIEMTQQLLHWQARLQHQMRKKINDYNNILIWCIRSFESPEKILLQHWQRSDLMTRALNEKMNSYFNSQNNRVQLLEKHLQSLNPSHQLNLHQQQLNHLILRFKQTITLYVEKKQLQLENLMQTLLVVGPQATLNRGYAIVSCHDKVLTSSKDATIGQEIDIQLSQGSLKTKVTEIKHA